MREKKYVRLTRHRYVRFSYLHIRNKPYFVA